MTWYLDPETGDVYEDDPEFSGQIATVEPDDNGDYRLERDLKPVMRETWENEANLGNSPLMSARAGHILLDLATGDWEFGTPS